MCLFLLLNSRLSLHVYLLEIPVCGSSVFFGSSEGTDVPPEVTDVPPEVTDVPPEVTDARFSESVLPSHLRRSFFHEVDILRTSPSFYEVDILRTLSNFFLRVRHPPDLVRRNPCLSSPSG